MMVEETEASKGTVVTWTPERSRGAALREEAAEAGGGEVTGAAGAEEEAAVEAGGEAEEEGLLCRTRFFVKCRFLLNLKHTNECVERPSSFPVK